MEAGFIYWEEGRFFVGSLDAYPGYRTQGETLENLKENLMDLLTELSSGNIPLHC